MSYSEVDIIMHTADMVNRCRSHILQKNKNYRIATSQVNNVYDVSYYDQFNTYHTVKIDMKYFKKKEYKKGYKSIW